MKSIDENFIVQQRISSSVHWITASGNFNTVDQAKKFIGYLKKDDDQMGRHFMFYRIVRVSQEVVDD